MMRNAIFVDTFAWLALANRTDRYHESAWAVFGGLREAHSRFITTNFVLVELINSLSSHSCRQQTVQFVCRIEASPSVRVVQVSEELYDLAWSFYQQRTDKDWGITDCTSFQVMGMLGLSRAFTNDQHFEQAGFELIRCSP
jgi:predicted nucleic acid-binding protein